MSNNKNLTSNLFVDEYDILCRKVIPGYELMHDLSQFYLKEVLPENASILNIGCGTCHETVVLSKASSSWRFCALDPSLEMVEAAKKKISLYAIEDRVDLIHGDIASIPHSSVFHAATLGLVLARIVGNDDKYAFLKAIHKKIIKNGYLIYCDLFDEDDECGNALHSSIWINHALSHGITPEFIDNALAYGKENLQRNTVEGALGILEKAGFVEPVLFFSANAYRAFLLKCK